MAQPDISQILAALAQQNGSQAPTPQQPAPSQPQPAAYPGVMPPQPPSAPSQGNPYLPQPSSVGSVDLSQIKPVSSGSVSIADAIAKAKSIASDRGISYGPRAASPREDPRLAGRGYRSRSRSRSPQRRDPYSSNPYRDERREDPRRGSYHRSPSPDRNFRGSRDPPPGYRANDGETETIRVKSSLVGLIIGRNGENLRKVEAESGARVQFIQAKDSQTQERQCTVSGSLRARENAKAAIFGIIEENGGSNIMQEKGAYTAGMPGRAKVNLPALREGENSTQIMVPDKTVGLIIGRGGETIKDLQERSGCHVNIVGENKSINGLRPVNLIGSDQATRVAKDLILEIVESDSRSSASNAMPASHDHGYDNAGQGGYGGGGGGRDHIEKTIQVPSEAVGMIIGKGGETIKQMQRDTGCKINVNQPKGNDVTRNIDLAGTARSMADAERIIWEKVQTVRERDAAAGRGGRGGGGGGYDQGPPRGGGYDGYSHSQQPPPVPGYGSYVPQPAQQPQAPPAVPGFGQYMPQVQSTPQPAAQGQTEQTAEQQAQYAQWYQQWMASQMANVQQYGGQQGGAAPGTQ